METQKKYENRIKELLKSISFEEEQLYETISLSEILKNRYVETRELEAYFSQNSNCYPFSNNDIQAKFGLSNDSFVELQNLLKESSKFICIIESDTESQIGILLENFFTNQYELISGNKNHIIQSIITELKKMRTNSNGDNLYQKYDKILEKIKKIIISASKNQFTNPSKRILENFELNDIAESISNQILKIKFNPDPAGYPRSLEQAKKRFLKNEEIVVTPVTEIEKNQIKNELVENIIDYIIYQKAKGKIQVTISQSKKTVFINDIVIPISLISEVINKLKTTILPSAFENINIYLTSSETEFLDEFYRKYILHIDDTHILGIENTDNFLQFLMKHKDEIKTRIQDMDSRIDASKQKNPLNFGNNVITFIGPRLLQEAPTLIYAKILPRKFDETPTTEEEIQKQIKTINVIQNNITEKMIDQREHSQIERLVYLLSLKNIDTVENISFENNKNGTPKNAITKVMEEKIYFLGNEFYQKYMTDEEFYNRINETINSMSLSKKKKIKKQYEELLKIQKFLNYKYKDISRAIIKYIDDPSKWIEYFSKKHNVSLVPESGVVGDGKLDNTKLGPYGIAQLLIEDEIHEYETNLVNGTDIENTLFNILKVCDKAYYLSNFNYITDIKRIFIIDSTNEQQNHIICEMNALNETLMAYFNGVNKNGVACFYSVQNTEEVFMKSFRKSNFGNIIDFKGKEYTTILAFDNPGKDQIITQNYSYAKKNIESIDDFIEKLCNGEIRLRLATSLSVEADYEQDQRKKHSDFIQKLLNRKRILLPAEAYELSLIGYSNADLMIENMSKEEAQKFIGIEDISDENLAFIQCVLKQKNIDNIIKAIDKRLQENSEANNILTNEKTRLQEIMRINQEVITKKDANGNDICFNTIEDIEKYFDNNKSNFKREHIVTLEYLAIIAKKKGSNELSEKIKKHCFKLFIKDEKEFLEKEYEKHYTIYLYQTGAKRGQTAVPEIVNPNNKNKSVEIFDREMLPLKQGCLQFLSRKIDSIFPNAGADDKIRYLEMADKELSSIIQVSSSKTSQTAFELEHDTEVKQNNARLRNLIDSKRNELKKEIQEIVNDPSLKEVDKPTAISSKIHDFITMIKSLSSQFVFDAKELIDQYHFEEDRETIKAHHEAKTRNYFAKTYEDNCSVESLIEVVIDTFKNEVESLKHKYELHGGYYFEQDLGDMETVLKISEKRTEFIKKLNQKSSVYRVSIWQIYESLVANNAALSINKKEDLREYIILRMAQAIREIEGKTGSKLFSQGLAEFNKDSFDPNMAEDIPRETLEQIRRTWH